MPIKYVAGDLFANTFAAKAFAQGCNCQGSMGAGIARGFKERYPAMFEQFRARCKANPRQFNLGDAWLWKADDQPWVFNLGTQEQFWHARASYDAIETALVEMQRQATVEGIPSIAIPRIGVGYGGLSWKKVRVIIERVFHDWPGQLIVYEEFRAASEQDGTQPETRQSERTPRIGKGSILPARSKTRPTSDGIGTEAKSLRRPRKKPTGLKVRFRAMTIACTDPARSSDFYETVLGAVRQPTDNGIGDWFRLGGIDLTLLPNATKKSPGEFPTHAMPILWLEVDDLAEFKRRIAEHGVTVIDEGDGQFLMIADPDGLVIEVWEQESRL